MGENTNFLGGPFYERFAEIGPDAAAEPETVAAQAKEDGVRPEVIEMNRQIAAALAEKK